MSVAPVADPAGSSRPGNTADPADPAEPGGNADPAESEAARRQENRAAGRQAGRAADAPTAEEAAAVEKAAPVEKAGLVEEAAPVEEASRTEEASAVEKAAPAAEASRAEGAASAEKASPAEKVSAARGRTTRLRLRRLALRLGALLVLLALWQITAAVMKNPAFIPSPAAVWQRLIETSTTHDGARGYSGHYLVEHLGVSLRRILIGSLIGVAAGLVVGVVMGAVPWIRVVTEPVVTFVRALPPLAYFSLFIIWFGIDETPKLWLLSIAALPPVAVAAASAVHAAPATLVEATRALGAGRLEVIRDVVLPHALPEIFTGIRLAVGIAYSSVVAAETINGVPGIGGMVRDAQRYSQTDVVVLGLFAIGLSGLAIDAVLRLAENRLIPWRGKN